MSAKPKTEAKTDGAAVAPKKKKGKLIGIVFGALILCAATGGAVWYFASAKGAAVEAAPKEEEPRALIALEPFVVNLADRGASHFFRGTIQLAVSEKGEIEDPVLLVRLRSAILELLSTQHAEDLTTPEGKAGLKKKIAETANQLLKPIHVIDVLFTDFVVQF